MADDVADRFRETGVVRVDSAFTPAEAGAIHNMVWRQVEQRSKVRLADAATWSAAEDGSFGLSALAGRSEFWPVLGNAAVQDALDVIFGSGGWHTPVKPSAQVLLTFPQPGPWVMPHGWHIDFGFDQPTWPVFAVKVFSFFGEVKPECGGTLVLEGSHRLVEQFAAGNPANADGGEDAFVPSYPWLEHLTRGGSTAEPLRELVGESHEVEGVRVGVVELTGSPGDVVITHMHVMHSPSPNAGDTPRQMLGLEVPRAVGST